MHITTAAFRPPDHTFTHTDSHAHVRMAVAAVEVAPLIDLGGTLDQPLSIDDMNKLDSSDVSVESDISSETSERNLEQEKSQLQREVFSEYLKANEDVDLAVTENGTRRYKIDEQPTGGKIIDEVRRYQQELFEKALEENVIAV